MFESRVRQDLLGSTRRGLFGDALAALDRSVGRTVHALSTLGARNKTLVIFTSDNGPALADGILGGSTGGLKCGKGSSYEGGMRVPSLWSWPGTIAPTAQPIHGLGSTLDVLPTLLSLAGAKPPKGLLLDGYDLSSWLLARRRGAAAAASSTDSIITVSSASPTSSPRSSFFYYQGPLLTAIRFETRYKLTLVSAPGCVGYNARHGLNPGTSHAITPRPTRALTQPDAPQPRRRTRSHLDQACLPSPSD